LPIHGVPGVADTGDPAVGRRRLGPAQETRAPDAAGERHNAHAVSLTSPRSDIAAGRGPRPATSRNPASDRVPATTFVLRPAGRTADAVPAEGLTWAAVPERKPFCDKEESR